MVFVVWGAHKEVISVWHRSVSNGLKRPGCTVKTDEIGLAWKAQFHEARWLLKRSGACRSKLSPPQNLRNFAGRRRLENDHDRASVPTIEQVAVADHQRRRCDVCRVE